MTIKSLKDSTTHRSDDYASSPVVSTEPSYFANPVLPGFHPDPCFCRAGDDYYLVTSTFNWLPGVSLYHSRDLVHWESLGGILDKLDLRGIPESGGVWAPDLTYANGEFWLVYSVAKTVSGAFKDVDNYLVRARDIEGPWSEPVLLGAKGFDPCLVHAQDGCRLVLPQWDWRPLEGHYKFNGVLMYDLDLNTGKTGDPVRIFDHTGDTPCVCEGPHIMERDGWFYLLAAEGGTGVNHRTVVARSRTVDGYYEPMPGNPLVSAAGTASPLIKSGHGNLVEGPDGAWYACHLCARHLPGAETCPLGRESALERIEWIDGWPRLAGGGNEPRAVVPAPMGAVAGTVTEPYRPDTSYATSFAPGSDLWREEWLVPHAIAPDRVRIAPAGGLLLAGGDSPSSLFDQTLVARRIQDFSFEASTQLDFSPANYNQAAGLVVMYDSRCYATLWVGFDEVRGVRVADVLICDNGSFSMPLGDAGRLILPSEGTVGLRVFATHGTVHFSVDTGEGWRELDCAVVEEMFGDEHVKGPHFTGCMVGIDAVDLTGSGREATFHDFAYRAI